MIDFQRLLETQEFKSEEDVRKFMDNMVGQKIPSFPKEILNLNEQAQDMVYEAYELPVTKGTKQVKKALELDPNCIEAYEYLATMEDNPEVSIAFLEKGIEIGKRIFGGKYLQEHKGMFWGFHETRPFMRCLSQYSECLYAVGKVKECVAVLEEMIELNPNDNQGVRDQLLLYLTELGENKKFLKYSKKYKHDSGAFALYTRALFAFKTEGETEKTNEQLKQALSKNKYVAPKLISNKAAIDLPESYGFGDNNEAKYYAFYAQAIWQQTKGAIEWLKKILHDIPNELKNK